MDDGSPEPRFGPPGRGAVTLADAWDGGTSVALARHVRVAARALRAPIACLTRGFGSDRTVVAWVGIGGPDAAGGPPAAAPDGTFDDVTMVPDLARDARFVDHPWVTGAPRVRFLAAAGVTNDRGDAWGELCVLDVAPRAVLDTEARAALSELASSCTETLRVDRLLREFHAARETAEHASSHDAVTGVLNRRGLTERLAGALALARRAGSTVTVALLGLGTPSGAPSDPPESAGAFTLEGVGRADREAELRAVAHRMMNAVRDHDLVARTGDAEFAVVLQAAEESSSVVVAARLLADLGSPDAVWARPFGLRASAGVASYPRDAEDMVGLLRAVAVALERAEAVGGGALAYAPDTA